MKKWTALAGSVVVSGMLALGCGSGGGGSTDAGGRDAASGDSVGAGGGRADAGLGDGSATDGPETDGAGAGHDAASIAGACAHGSACASGFCLYARPAITACKTIVGIAAGGDHTCAVTNAANVLCWGNDGNGQLGDGMKANSAVPIAASVVDAPAVAVAAGYHFTCALSNFGGVECWGDNADGDLGNGSTSASASPVTPTGLAAAEAITAGRYHACALTRMGGVMCWGYNASGQLGNGSTTDSHVPVTVVSSGAAAVSAGRYHTCLLTTDGNVYCWGESNLGQVGSAETAAHSSPVLVAGLVGVVAIAALEDHTCALTSAGAVMCWGQNASGQLGDGTMTNSHTPVRASLPAGVVATAITGGADHTCALTSTGDVWCWGDNSSGQLGTASPAGSAVPLAVTGLSGPAAAIAAGSDHTCALTTAGDVQCWGDDTAGQLGTGQLDAGAMGTSAQPAAIVWPPGICRPTLAETGSCQTISSLSAGATHTCAATAAGAVVCWGDNDDGELGDGASVQSDVPAAVSGLTGPAATVTAGTRFSCALTTAGGAMCWGSNQQAELGNNNDVGTMYASPIAVPVAGLSSGVAAISAGDSRACALTSAGGVLCWGADDHAQLGVGTASGPQGLYMPAPVTGLSSGVAAIAVGGDQSCALTTAGGVICWGTNPSGVAGLSSGVAAIAVGGHHACALTTSGAAKCWGANDEGQLGDGSTNDSSAPVAVTGLSSGVAAIAAGESHTCALTTTGAAICWGGDGSGQLGDSSRTNSLVPVPVTGRSSGVAAIAAGGNHTCALTTGGALICWGDNASGDLGDASGAESDVPIGVVWP